MNGVWGHEGAEHLHVEANSGTVTLRGEVHSWAQRQDVERAAWGARGVTHVDDRITFAF